MTSWIANTLIKGSLLVSVTADNIQRKRQLRRRNRHIGKPATLRSILYTLTVWTAQLGILLTVTTAVVYTMLKLMF